MTTTLNDSLRNTLVDAAGAAFAAGAIELYTGTQPGPNVAPTGTLLVTCTALAYGAAAAGSASTTAAISGVAVATGTAGYARQRNAGSTKWTYGSVTVTGGGGDVELLSVAITNGGTVTIDLSTIDVPDTEC